MLNKNTEINQVVRTVFSHASYRNEQINWLRLLTSLNYVNNHHEEKDHSRMDDALISLMDVSNEQRALFTLIVKSNLKNLLPSIISNVEFVIFGKKNLSDFN